MNCVKGDLIWEASLYYQATGRFEYSVRLLIVISSYRKDPVENRTISICMEIRYSISDPPPFR